MRSYILPYSQFLLEQDMGAPVPPAQPQTAPVKEKPYRFIFMDESERSEWDRKRYPDGSMEVTFKAYAVTPEQIKDWAEKNVISTSTNGLSKSMVELRKKNIIGIVSGDKMNISKEDIPFIEKLKHAVASDFFGSNEPPIIVIYARDGEATTEDVDVTFIKYKS